MRPSHELNLKHIENPQAGDYWQEMLVPIMIVVEPLDDGAIVLLPQVGDDGRKYVDVAHAVFMTSAQLLRKTTSQYAPEGEVRFHCDVMPERYTAYARGWLDHRGDRDPKEVAKAYNKGRLGPVLNMNAAVDWSMEHEAEYASCTVRAQRLRLVIRGFIDSSFLVTHGKSVLYSGNSLNRAITEFNRITDPSGELS